MSTRRQNRKLATLRDRLDRAATAQPNVDEHCNEQRNLVGYIASSRTDSTGGHTSDHSDQPARVTLELDKVNYKHQTTLHLIDRVKDIIDLLETAQGAALGHRARREPADPQQAAPRCIGDNTAAGATCWQIPIERRDHNTNQTINDGLCIDCGRRSDERRRRDAERKRLARTASPA